MTAEQERLVEAIRAEYEKCRTKWDGHEEPAALETLERLFSGAIIPAPEAT